MMNDRVLDVRPGDLTAATAALQRLGLALFEELFDNGPGLTAERWFASSDARALDRIPFTRLGWRRLVARAAPFLSDAVTDRKRWASSPRPPEPWRRWTSNRLRWSGAAIRARLALDAHGAEGLLIPDRLLGLVARAAWESPAFRVQAATLVLDHFRSRLIAPADGFAAPRIAPGLVWMILATARVTPPRLVQLGLAHRAQRRALVRLQRFAHAMLDESALPDDFWSHWIAWHVERRYGQRSKLPPEWHSRLSAADRPGETAIRRRSRPIDPSQPWTAPEALAAAYAAWYPVHPVVRRQHRTDACELGESEARAGASARRPASAKATAARRSLGEGGSGAGHGAPASDGVGAKPPDKGPDRSVARVRLDPRS
jgi:hypothetical protein